MSQTSNSDYRRAEAALMSASSAVIAMDLMNAQALGLGAELSQAFKQVSEGMSIAQQLQMRYLFVGVNKGLGRVICMPLMDMDRASRALAALREQLMGKGAHSLGKTAWVVLPEAFKQALIPQVEKAWGEITLH